MTRTEMLVSMESHLIIGYDTDTDRSAKVANIVTVETLLLDDGDGSPRTGCDQREACKAPRHDNDDGAMVGRGQCYQGWQRIGRHDRRAGGCFDRRTERWASDGAYIGTCRWTPGTRDVVQAHGLGELVYSSQ